MKRLIKGLIVAALLAAVPAWAHGGHGHWQHGKHWQKHPVHQHYVVREVYRPLPMYPRAVYPVYPVYAAPAPGIHIVLPGLFVPFR